MLDDAANNRLLQSAWRCVQTSNDTVYYVKHHIGNNDYRLLVTDLRRVWYDSADAQQLYKKSSQHWLVLENDAQLSELLSHLGTFLQSLDKCTIRESSSTRLQIECAELQGFARLTWTFMCQVLSGFEGATVLYDHFILPMLMMAENQPDVQRNIEFGKPDQPCRLNQAWLSGLEQATQALASSRIEQEESASPTPPPPLPADHAKTDPVVAQEQVPQASQDTARERETRIVRQQPAKKKRRLFG